MPFSHYLKKYPWKEKSGYLLLFSTKRAASILLKEETCQAIESGFLFGEEKAILVRLGMIVSDREEEKRSLHGLLEELNRGNKGLNLTLVLNLDCNFNCRYCYEEGLKAKVYLQEEKVKELIDFIQGKFSENKNYLNLNFYGGEPLLSRRLIQSISREMKSFCETRGASYGFMLVTNGSLLKKELACELSQLGLTGVKITLDGPEKIHNNYRPFKSGRGSFEIIIRNIKDTCEIVSIQLGGNYTRENYREFPLLLDYLSAQGLTPDKISGVKFDPILQTGDNFTLLRDFREGCESANEPWIIESSLFLREEILKRGYFTPKPVPLPCVVEIKDTLVVNYDGDIYKCPALIGRKEFAIGSLGAGIKDYRDSYNLDFWKRGECLDCEYLPLCFGGCRYMKLLRDGNIDEVDCKRRYFDATLETFVKQDIKYRREGRN